MRNRVWLSGVIIGTTIPFASAQDEIKSSINLTMEHRHAIVEFLKDAPLSVQTSGKLEIGNIVPSSTPLAPIPADLGSKVPQIKEHVFVLTVDEIVLVSEKDRKVADVIKRDPR